MLYSDEDKIDRDGKHQDGFFKPDWSPDLLLSMNYVCHFLVCRRSLLKEIGGLRLGFDGSQDYDLILRLSEKSHKIRRIPKVLYHWRIHDQSTASGVSVKPAASDAGRRAIEEHLERRGVAAQVIETSPGRYRVRYKIDDRPEVAIIIPTGGSKTLGPALESIRTQTTYRNHRIIVVDNSRIDTPKKAVETARARGQKIDLLDCRGLPFNFSLLCNRAARAVESPYLLFLNDDTSVITPEWIEAMLEHAQRAEVGAVGAQLLFPNDTIQHAGVVTGLFDAAGHPFRGMPDKPFYFDLSHVTRNCAAVTGACLMTRRDVFESVGGYDEPNLPTCFQDVDLCLKMLESGYRIVYTPFARLYHYESVSKKSVAELPEIRFMKERWQSFIADDPFYNPNLTRRSDDFSLNYDYLFASRTQRVDVTTAAGSRPPAVTPTVGTQAARRVSHFGNIEFYAAPNPAKPGKRGLGQTTLYWSVPGSDKVQVRVGSPRGPLFAEGGSHGKSATGPWVESGTVFYLQDATESDPSPPECVLATARVTVTPLTKATAAH
jgi:GT2 family glycosyltransferase